MTEERMAEYKAHKDDWYKLSLAGIGLPAIAAALTAAFSGEYVSASSAAIETLAVGVLCFVIGGCAGGAYEKAERARLGL